jgi:hypothetical protein
MAKAISHRLASPWGKNPQKHRPLRALNEARFRWRAWIVLSVATVGDLASYLRSLLHPAKLGAIGSLLVCFVIVMTPPQLLFRSSTTTGSPSAVRQRGFEVTTAELFERATRQTPALRSSREASNPAPEQAELTVTDEALQASRETPQVEIPKRDLLNRDHVKEVQRKLIQLGYLSVSATGVWGPLSRMALRAFKSDHALAADGNWDQVTERSLFSIEPAEPFVGIWGVDASACSARLNRKGFLPAIIDGEGAWAGETFCTFERKRRTAQGWNVVASCSNAHDRWTANVRLIINGDQLTWTSERGSQSYLRCQPGLGVARVL